MSSHSPRIAVTAASGQLGRLVVASLLKASPGADVVAVARSPAKIADLAALGATVRPGDYDDPAALEAAFEGVGRLLLISSSELGRRVEQHGNVIAAAKAAGVGLIVYTSVLHADGSPLGLAEEHRQTEAALKASGVPYVVLRNGWYTENYTGSIPPALASGSFYGSAKGGLISSAARADYADAAVAVLTSDDDAGGRVYELAGDDAYTLAEFTAEIATLSGKPVGYVDMPKDAYRDALVGAGLPEAIAELLADSDVAAAKGALHDDGRALSALIGRPTTPWRETVAAAVNG